MTLGMGEGGNPQNPKNIIQQTKNREILEIFRIHFQTNKCIIIYFVHLYILYISIFCIFICFIYFVYLFVKMIYTSQLEHVLQHLRSCRHCWISSLWTPSGKRPL